MSGETMRVALAQTAPVWLDREATTSKVCACIERAAQQGAALVCFGEALLPGYPFWLELTGGAEFNSPKHKQMHAHYLQQAVCIQAGHLDAICDLARQLTIAVVLGTVERAADRGGHSLYCSLVYIDRGGEICSVHRKLMPTYEERLAWSPGDGHGLRAHSLPPFTLGALNCWENWMPLARSALYAQGEDLHVAIWPGGEHNTADITRFIAKEGRSYVLSVSGLMRPSDFPLTTPLYEELVAAAPTTLLANGGSCVAGPDGEWILPPQVGEEGVYLVELDHSAVYRERQNFDPVGHYARPDVTCLHVNRSRQTTVRFEDDN